MALIRTPASIKEAEAHRRKREQEFINSPLYLWDQILGGGQLARDLAQPIPTTLEERRMDPLEQLREAMVRHASDGEPLVEAVRRWTPSKEDPRRSLSGQDLDQFPAEHVQRKRREAIAALRSHDSAAVSLLNPLIAAAEAEPARRFQVGSRLEVGAVGETQLLVQQYRDLPRQQQMELQTLGQQAAERGDLQLALAHKRAAEVLHVQVPELDDALAKSDPVRRDGKAALDNLDKLVQAYHADEARRHVRAGIADSVEQVGHSTWAQQNGYEADGSSGSYVAAVAGQEA